MYVYIYITADISQQICYGRYITVDILWHICIHLLRHLYRQTYHGRYVYYGRGITADILWQIHYIRQIYYGRYMTADILRQTYYGRCITENILRHVYYGRCVTADILRQIYYGRYITAEALNCCHWPCLLRPIAPRTPRDRSIYKKAAKIKQTTTRHQDVGEVDTVRPETPPPSYILYINKYIYIYIYVRIVQDGWPVFPAPRSLHSCQFPRCKRVSFERASNVLLAWI